MNLKEALEFARKAFEALEAVPGIVQTGGDALNLIRNTRERLEAMSTQGRGPTQEEKDAQDALIAQLRSELHQGEQDSGG